MSTYEAPKLTELGTLHELTQGTGTTNTDLPLGQAVSGGS